MKWSGQLEMRSLTQLWALGWVFGRRPTTRFEKRKQPWNGIAPGFIFRLSARKSIYQAAFELPSEAPRRFTRPRVSGRLPSFGVFSA
jgi:hypothetical protein